MDQPICVDVSYFINIVRSTDWALVNHCLNRYSITFILDGRGDYDVDGQYFRAEAGDVVFIKPGSIRNASTTGMSIIAIDFYHLQGPEIDLPTVFTWGDFEEFHLLFQELKLEWLLKKPGYHMKSQAYLIQILYKLIYERNREKRNPHVEMMKKYITKHYMKPLTVKEIATTVKLSPVYCGSLFRKMEGCTIAEFISRVRINRAYTLLETGDRNVSEVAEEVGFSDVFYFSNTFKKLTGMSPSHVKKTRI